MSIRRIAAIAGVELRHAWRRPLWIVLAVVMLLAAWGFVAGGLTVAVGSQAAAGERAWINSQFNMSIGVAVLYSMVYAFWFAIGAGMPLIDDDSSRVGPVLHATPLTAREYVWGRFLGVFGVILLLVAVNVAAYMFFFELYPIDEPDKARGPFQVLNYLWVFALFALPSTIFFAGTSFSVGALTRRPVLVFVLPVAALLACLFFVWTFSPRWLPDGVDRLLQAIDPAGVRWLTSEHLRERRPIAYYNHEPIRPDWLFGLSRAAFAAIGLAGVAWTARREARLVRGVAATGDPKALLAA
ncbi:MAG: ABC transporter permease, partial [Phycisphaerales bacterium]|nr:ABC transporter permease [Phycisphaerales bacterium]